MTKYILTTGIALALFATTALAEPAHVDHRYPTPQPNYPASSQAAGEQGDVTIGVYVNASGTPRKVKLVKSSGYHDLDMAAAEGVINWRFVPMMTSGEPESSWTQVTVHYELPKPDTGAQPAAVKSQID